jgi:Flp pilus assembly protein TadG
MYLPTSAKAATRFRRDADGSVAIIFALLITALFGICALAVDMARAYNVSSKVTTALDASALAGAKMLDTGATDTEIKDHSRAFFDSHVKSLHIHATNLVNFAATIDRVNSTVTTKVDVAMGTTFGRMLGRDAINMNKSSTVNYKILDIELAMALDVTGSMGSNGKMSEMKHAARDVVEIMMEDAPSENAVRIAVVPWSSSVNAGSLSSTVSGNASTDGCVVERTNSNAATDVAPMGADALRVTSYPTSEAYLCPSESIMPLAGKSRKSDLRDKIQDMNANGGTAGHIGTAWGWYLVAPNWSSVLPVAARPAAYNKNKTIKAVLLMTDGEFNVSHANPGPYTSAQIDESYNQFRALCTAMKDKDVMVYTVGFEITAGSRADTELKTCASAASNYFLATNGNELRKSFRAIANQLMSLRISR